MLISETSGVSQHARVEKRVIHIGNFILENPFLLAPMAGITDRPFRNLCRSFGAALAYCEMISSNPRLQNDRKTLIRTNHSGESGIRAVQILGNDPGDMAEAARINVDRGADLIDINMGCPAKKVCRKAAGSSLLRDERLVAEILAAVVGAVNVPVTLKIRTGWDTHTRNALRIGQIAESEGIRALTIHGRTRACGFSGEAEYRTISDVKASIKIPVIANGDIHHPDKAMAVLRETGADAVMIGRAALGQPWLFALMNRKFSGISSSEPPPRAERFHIVARHLEGLYDLYGEFQGIRVARKHLGWYLDHLELPVELKADFNRQTTSMDQLALLRAISESGKAS